MPQIPPAKKAQQTCNMSGIRNQHEDFSNASDSSGSLTPARSLAPRPEVDKSDLEEDDNDLDLLIQFDSLKMNLAYEEEHSDCMEKGEDVADAKARAIGVLDSCPPDVIGDF